MKNLKNLNHPIKILISLSILTLLVLRMDTAVLSNMVSHFSAAAWIWAILFTFAQMVLLALRWKILANVGKSHLTFKDSLQINLTSQLANLVFITSIGGMLVRIALSLQHGMGILKTVIATAIDRILTLAGLVILTAAFLPGLAPYVDNKIFANLSGYLSVFMITLFIFTPVFLGFILKKIPQHYRMKVRIRYGIRYLKVFMNNPVMVGKTIFVSLVAQTAFFVSVFCLCISAQTDLSFAQLMTVLPVISLIAALPISIGGWGVREGAFVFGLGLLGVSMETAFLISIQVGLIGMVSIILAGIPSLLTSDFKLSRIPSLQSTLSKIRLGR